jgi:hypothetical protein
VESDNSTSSATSKLHTTMAKQMVLFWSQKQRYCLCQHEILVWTKALRSGCSRGRSFFYIKAILKLFWQVGLCLFILSICIYIKKSKNLYKLLCEYGPRYPKLSPFMCKIRLNWKSNVLIFHVCSMKLI